MNSQLEVEKSELENKFTEALSVLQGKVKVLYLHIWMNHIVNDSINQCNSLLLISWLSPTLLFVGKKLKFKSWRIDKRGFPLNKLVQTTPNFAVYLNAFLSVKSLILHCIKFVGKKQ